MIKRFNRTDLTLSLLGAILLQLEVWVFDPLEPRWARALLSLVAAGALAFMRRAPFVSYLVNGFSVYGLIALGVPSDYYQWTNFIALVVMATRTSFWRSVVGLGLGFGGIAFYFLRFPEEGGPLTMLFVMALYLAGWLIGRAQLTRVREEELRSERDLSEARLAVKAAEAELAAERNRIAQELHDIVGHAVNLMVVQAGAGDRVFHSDPEAARQSLQAIANTGRTALIDLDRMLGMLSESDSRNSLPTLEGVEALCAEFRQAGLSIDSETRGDLDRVPSSISLAGYRLVQEALTNVLKHSGATEVHVTVAVTDELSIVVADNGRGGEPSPGRGFRGMIQRAELHGGRVSFSSPTSGGFQVESQIPLP